MCINFSFCIQLCCLFFRLISFGYPPTRMTSLYIFGTYTTLPTPKCCCYWLVVCVQRYLALAVLSVDGRRTKRIWVQTAHIKYYFTTQVKIICIFVVALLDKELTRKNFTITLPWILPLTVRNSRVLLKITHRKQVITLLHWVKGILPSFSG